MASGNIVARAEANVMQYDNNRASWQPTAGTGSSTISLVQYTARDIINTLSAYES